MHAIPSVTPLSRTAARTSSVMSVTVSPPAVRSRVSCWKTFIVAAILRESLPERGSEQPLPQRILQELAELREARLADALQARQRLADAAVEDPGRPVLAAGEDPPAGRAEARSREPPLVPGQVEEQRAGARIPEPRVELARGHDPAAVRAVPRAQHREEVPAQDVDEPARRDVPRARGVVVARSEER